MAIERYAIVEFEVVESDEVVVVLQGEGLALLIERNKLEEYKNLSLWSGIVARFYR